MQFDSITEYNSHRCQKKHATPTECPGINEPPTKRTKSNDVIQSSPPLGNISSINNSPPLTSQIAHEDTAPLSTDPGVNQPPSKIKKVKTFVKQKWREIEYYDDEISEQGDQSDDCLQSHWSSIRSFVRKGEIQSLYNYYYNQNFKDMVARITESIMRNRNNRFKINYAIGYILRNVETDEFRYYHPSNNVLALNTAKLISNRGELMNFLENIAEEDFLDNVTRPDTKWKVHRATNILFFVHKLNDTPLSTNIQLPDYIKLNRGPVNVKGDDKLCFFRCLAVFKGSDPRWCDTTCKELYNLYNPDVRTEVYKGVKFSDFPQIEDLFKINVVIYELEGNVAKLIQKSREIYDETIRLNAYQNHLSLITDFEKYCSVYQCTICDELWYKRKITYVIVEHANPLLPPNFQVVFLNLRKLFLKN